MAEDTAAAAAKLDRYLHLLAQQLEPQVHEAFRRIEGPPRQWLALRSYLRTRERLPDRWSWSEAQIETFAKSREYRQLIAEVERVRARFEADNPGYTLYANTKVRSLDTQLQRWNANRTVGRVAESIQRALRKELLKSSYPTQPDAGAVSRLHEFLSKWHPGAPAPLAAPGLSLHGQLRAIDFQVMQEGRIVAQADISVAQSVWEDQGWSEKLQRATAGTRFVGPLQAPHEPWHYEYAAAKPAVRSAAR